MEAAAKTIQQNWRRTKAVHRQDKYQRKMDDAMIDIQSAFQGHLVRTKLLSSSQSDSRSLSKLELCDNVEGSEERDDSSGSSQAIELLQSAMKGYLTRQMTLLDLKRLNIVLFVAVSYGM